MQKEIKVRKSVYFKDDARMQLAKALKAIEKSKTGPRSFNDLVNRIIEIGTPIFIETIEGK